MKHSTFLLGSLSLLLVACVDTTGINTELTSGPHPLSNPNGAVVVAEYADLQCPACKAAHEQLIGPLLQQYGKDIRYEFHHFPLSSIHRYAMEAAEAAECAADQGKFWEFVDLVYRNQEELSREQLDAWAEELDLDMDLFGRCRKSDIKRDSVQASYEEGREMGVNSTPTFFVNGQKVQNTMQDLGAAIEKAKQAAGMLL